jgi:hypothetical protein
LLEEGRARPAAAYDCDSNVTEHTLDLLPKRAHLPVKKDWERGRVRISEEQAKALPNNDDPVERLNAAVRAVHATDERISIDENDARMRPTGCTGTHGREEPGLFTVVLHRKSPRPVGVAVDEDKGLVAVAYTLQDRDVGLGRDGQAIGFAAEIVRIGNRNYLTHKKGRVVAMAHDRATEVRRGLDVGASEHRGIENVGIVFEDSDCVHGWQSSPKTRGR